MIQEIKVPVRAQTQGAERAAGGLAAAFSDVAAAVAKIGSNASRAQASVLDLVHLTSDLHKMRERLSQVLGGEISKDDTLKFAAGWRSLQQARGPATAAVRRFGSFDAWYEGHEALYSSPGSAARHRRAMLASAGAGTDWAAQNAPVGDHGEAGGGGFGGGGRGGGRGGDFDSGLGRSRAMAMSFGKSMLALAGRLLLALIRAPLRS